MTYEDIKIILIRKHKTIAGLAADYEKKTGKPCRREEMSQCIRQIKYRHYPELREFLEIELEEPNLWKDQPPAKKKARVAA